MATALFAREAYGGVTLSDGLDVTTTNSGASVINKLSGGIVKWRAESRFGGSYIVETTNSSNNAATLRLPFANSSYNVSVAMDFVCPALPGATDGNVTILTVRTSTGGTILVQIKANGLINVSASATFAIELNTALVPGTNYRIEVTAAGSATVATGTLAARIYNYGAEVNNFLSQSSISTANFGTNPFLAADAGTGQYPAVRTLLFSNVRLVDGSSSFQGPYVAASQPLSAGVTLSPTSGNTPLAVTATASKAGGTATVFTYAFDWGDGSSTAAQSSNVATHTYTTAGTFTVTVTVTGT